MRQEKLVVQADIVSVETGKHIASCNIPCQLENMMEASLRLAQELAKQMKISLPEVDMDKIAKVPTAQYHFAKGIEYFYASKMDEAIMHFMQAEDLDSNYTETHFWQGLGYLKQGEEDHAIIEWEAFLKAAPHSPYAEAAKKLIAAAKKARQDEIKHRVEIR